jgi:lysophospholipase L1-like esterase
MTPALRAVLLSPKITLDRLFRGRLQAWCADPSDLSKLFQASNGTGAVASTADPIGKIVDISGKYNHLLQATAGLRPTFKEDAGLRSVVFDGIAQFMAAAGVNFTGATKVTLVMGVRQLVVGTTGSVVLECGNATSAGGGFGTFFNNTTSGAFGTSVGYASNYIFNNATNSTLARTYVASVVFNPNSTALDDRLTIRINGVNINGVSPASAGTPAAASIFGSKTLSLGRRETGVSYSNFEFFGGMFVTGEFSARELAYAEDWCADRAGVTLPNMVYAPSTFADSGTTSVSGGHVVTSPFAQAQYTTTATSLAISSYNDIFASFPTFTELGVYVDGAYLQSVPAPAAGSTTAIVELAAGSKTVSIVNGSQSKPASSVIGTFVTQIAANAAMTAVAPSASNRVAIYGDSIAVGANSSPITQKAWALLVRADYYPDSLAVEGYGYRTLHSDCVNAPARAAFVAKIVTLNPERLVIAIGTNDYGLEPWSAASFGTAYAALLDDLNTALPTMTIFCVTPLLRTVETANAYGDTLGAYRTQISTAVGTRGSFCTLVDGTAIMTVGSLDADGLHPTTAGHALYADAVKTALGIA